MGLQIQGMGELPDGEFPIILHPETMEHDLALSGTKGTPTESFPRRETNRHLPEARRAATAAVGCALCALGVSQLVRRWAGKAATNSRAPWALRLGLQIGAFRGGID